MATECDGGPVSLIQLPAEIKFIILQFLPVVDCQRIRYGEKLF